MCICVLYLRVGKKTMVLHSAKDVIDKIEFNNQEDWDTYPAAEYCCDKCEQIVSIDFKSLTKHQFSNFTNFDISDKQIFEALHKPADTNSFLDFYCPSCKRPVRIYYESWAGGRHGEAGHVIKYVID